MINSEKDFIKSNSRSAQDFHKVTDSIKSWADSEGEDMQVRMVVAKGTLIAHRWLTPRVTLPSLV